MITLLSAVGCHTSSTALQTSTAYSTSVPGKLSGEYSNEKLPVVSLASSFNRIAPSTAICLISSLLLPKTCSLCATDVELYRWTIARGAPLTASKVLRMICSLAWVSTCTVTSCGIILLSISVLRNAYSVSEAAGNPTSISLKPISTSILKYSTFSSKLIGSISA